MRRVRLSSSTYWGERESCRHTFVPISVLSNDTMAWQTVPTAQGTSKNDVIQQFHIYIGTPSITSRQKCEEITVEIFSLAPLGSHNAKKSRWRFIS